MKLQFWAIGRDHETYVDTGVKEFTKRISNYFQVEWKILPVPRNAGLMTAQDLKRKESDAVFKLLSDTDFLVVLDERGKLYTSTQVADFLAQRANESTKKIIYLIGGAFGIDELLLKRANLTWSLSPLTFPHQLVRLILAEQVYRACTILKNEKYHHV